ncbi:hypothetical protein GUJ93_ZPchr0013g35942 [Zizania palustris]|uniref:Uncharacterized protein n=1 Tax=Zizania palustris TaxID=103762 RepID=A0A8J6C028_ZIZPA|nr:hypothetical protein GUJ93_ZPchr0013g35942 [Zizania palustris]
MTRPPTRTTHRQQPFASARPHYPLPSTPAAVARPPPAPDPTATQPCHRPPPTSSSPSPARLPGRPCLRPTIDQLHCCAIPAARPSLSLSRPRPAVPTASQGHPPSASAPTPLPAACPHDASILRPPHRPSPQPPPLHPVLR